jgi:hypothetical protein
MPHPEPRPMPIMARDRSPPLACTEAALEAGKCPLGPNTNTAPSTGAVHETLGGGGKGATGNGNPAIAESPCWGPSTTGAIVNVPCSSASPQSAPVQVTTPLPSRPSGFPAYVPTIDLLPRDVAADLATNPLPSSTPQLKPWEGSPPARVPPSGPIDLLADPRGQGSLADFLTADQRRELEQKIDDWAVDQIKSYLMTKPFEKSWEPAKKAFQEDVAAFGSAAAIAACGGNPACGLLGFWAGWHAGGKLFDKTIDAAVSAMISGPNPSLKKP